MLIVILTTQALCTTSLHQHLEIQPCTQTHQWHSIGSNLLFSIVPKDTSESKPMISLGHVTTWPHQAQSHRRSKKIYIFSLALFCQLTKQLNDHNSSETFWLEFYSNKRCKIIKLLDLKCRAQSSWTHRA